MNATDYLWFSEQFPYFADAYCLTFVQGLGAAEVLERIDAERIGDTVGLQEFVGARPIDFDGVTFYVGATEVDVWTMLVEENGYLGVTPEVIGPLSTGTQVVSHFRNVNAVDYFYWMVNGDLRLSFEPLFPSRRSGSDADGQLDAMLRAGFDLSDAEDRDFSLHTEAAFALAERLTGVRVTAELLESADYLCGMAPRQR
jgi:hypothetical protein